MKKLASVVLLSLVPLTLASCGLGNNDNTTTTSSKTEKVAKSSKSASSSTNDEQSSQKTSSSSSSDSQKQSDSQSSATNSNESSQTSSSSSSSSSSLASNTDTITKMSREDLTAAEKKNGNQPLAGESIKNVQSAIDLLTQKYGDKGWTIAHSSVGLSSPIYFHITSDNDGAYYVFANGEIKSADGDLS
jgi:DNA mismatch repair ATPase MutL